MALWSALLGVVGLAAVVTAVAVARGDHPGEQRRAPYETDDGEPINPIADVSAGAAAARARCALCGATLEAESFKFCESCGATALGDE